MHASSVKNAMPVGLGLLLALCGLQQMRVVVSDKETGVAMGAFSWEMLLGICSTLVMVSHPIVCIHHSLC